MGLGQRKGTVLVLVGMRLSGGDEALVEELG
jgi:hypothetical protein